MNFRKEWFNHVAVVRKRLARKSKKGCTHKEAMAQASISWPKEKAKLKRKAVREAKKAKKTVSSSSPPVPRTEDEQS